MVFGNQVNTPSGIAYRYSPTQNNGQITQAVDSLSGETISYQYDALKRLASASATPTSGSSAPAWAQSFQYDGFGNLTGKVLNGTATPIPVNAATNQLSNAYYDANGNMTSGAGGSFGYDVANRMISATEYSGGQEIYAYAPDGKQIFKSQCGFFFATWTGNGMEGSCPMEFTLYGAYGEKLTVFNIAAQYPSDNFSYTWNFVFLPMGANVRFAGQLIQSDSGPVFQDRLGSNRAGVYPQGDYSDSAAAQYYPYGDEVTSTTNDRVKFATYTRDGYTGLDYAQQRFYASTYGRFNTVDPSWTSVSANSPGTWNRYSYARLDPVNRKDPKGLDDDDDDDDGGSFDDGNGLFNPNPAPCIGYGNGCDCYQALVLDPACVGTFGLATAISWLAPSSPPPPPPLRCDYAGADTEAGFFDTVTNSQTGVTGESFNDSIQMTFGATGGTGSYQWSVQQYAVLNAFAIYANGQTASTSFAGFDAVSASQLQVGGTSLTFSDYPGLWIRQNGLPGGSPLMVGGINDMFRTTVTLTSGSQTIRCPTVSWVATLNWPRRRRATGTIAVTGVSGVFP